MDNLIKDDVSKMTDIEKAIADLKKRIEILGVRLNCHPERWDFTEELLAYFYHALWAAKVKEALKEKRTEKILENACELIGQDFNCPYNYVVDCLKAQAERDNPQPLTLEQLKQRVGKPVWITGTDEWQVISSIFANRLYAKDSEGEAYALDYYGKTWLAYDHEPKEQVK